MRALGVDTTRNFLVVVLVDDDRTYFEVVKEGNKKHTALLIPTIDKILSTHNLRPADIDYFSAIVGPGSFTGIRVGVSTINAMAYVENKPVISVTSFDLIAYGKESGATLIDALHGNYYGAYFKNGNVTEMRYFESGDEILGDIYKQDDDDDYALAYGSIIRKKISKSECDVALSPLYLRESQAEREAVKNA